MLNRTSRSDESLREYFYDKLGLLSMCEITGKKAVDCIVYGISDRSVRNGAQALDSTEPEDLLTYLSSQKPQQAMSYNNRPRERTFQKPNNSANTNTGASNSNLNSVICYNCRVKGHPYFKCTKPLTICKRCNRVGHDSDRCRLDSLTSTNRNSNNNVENFEKKKNTLKIDTTNDPNSKFFKTITINDHSLKAYIDFGSECTLLRKSDAKFLKLAQNYDNIPIVRGFGQSSVIPLYKTFVSVRVDDIESIIEVLVVDDAHMQVSVIIGQNFTEQPIVTVLKNSDNLTFYLSPNKIPFDNDEDTLKLYVTDTTNISKTGVVPVQIDHDFTGDIFIGGYNSVEPRKYRDCFATNLGEIGCAVDVEMKIDLVDNKPIVYRPYRLSHSEREKVRETVNELVQNNIVQESKSDYASPILMVKKKTGEQRLCVDFRALNNKTVKDRFPLPLIDDQLSNLSGNTFFTTLDLASGYYQIPMAPSSRHLTAFVTPDGHYEFLRMPFGLANAPAVFQRMINKILGNKRFEYALAYLDDVLIPSKGVDEMFWRLEEVLKIFRVRINFEAL
ncbi:uncharacterized protein LOC124541665 [Vanessa cardui]|uniref:uncharacterized protein LOC124541665 n=1 Tax=Vanessa cardui TaxID=171605 RepID=UPI001F13BE68|nr:uncharacterized protein LOC124541665 [Vanessa cardui]